MGVRNSFKYKDVSKKLKELECAKRANCKGSHEIWYNTIADKEFTVVNHGADNMRQGTLRAMLKLAEIDEQDFLDA